jgi:uncharacterized protein (TIGR02594 family)
MNNHATALGTAIAEAARAQIGTTEWADGSNPAIEAYWREAGIAAQPDDVPWCAVFVGAVLGRCGVPGTRSPAARSYLAWGEPVDRDAIEPGDVLVSWRGAPDSWTGHVEIATRWENGDLITVGGNERDAVREAPYRFDKFLGARRARPPRGSIDLASSKTVREASRAGAGGLLAQLPDAVAVAATHVPLLEKLWSRLPWWADDVLVALGIALLTWGVVALIAERRRKALAGDR